LPLLWSIETVTPFALGSCCCSALWICPLACSSELVLDCGSEVWFELCVPLTAPVWLCDAWFCEAEASPCGVAEVED